jgi:RHS repeat-associated protein
MDGLGRRIEKNVNDDLTRYVYEQEEIVLESDGQDRLRARYTHGLGVDEPLIVAQDGNGNGSLEKNAQLFYQADVLGSITELTNASGQVVQSYVYEAFGGLVQQVGTVPNPYAYTGWEMDPESGLHYYRTRYYDPAIGRFLQEDPVQNELTQPSTLNLYAYVRNNPINRQEPFGLQPQLGTFNPPLTRTEQIMTYASATTGSVVGGAMGMAAGATTGSTVPIFGTTRGGMVGAATGAVAGGLAG